MIDYCDKSNMASATKTYLILRLGSEHYGIDMLQVREMKSWGKVTTLPKTPESVCGLVNLRGEVVPVIDLRLCLGMEKIAPSITSIIIVLDVNGPQKQLSSVVGIIVDEVEDQCEIAEKTIKSAPNFGDFTNTSYIKGLSPVGEDIVTILDIDVVLSAEALA
jgi:purine-binding chemotaxis protein CheW